MKHIGALIVTIAIAAPGAPANAVTPSADAQHGAVVFRQCTACHKIGPNARNSIGPALTGVVGRHAASYPGYSYSSAMKRSQIVWSEAELERFLHAPRAVVPGTKMSFIGLKRDQDVSDVIAYLKTFGAPNSHTAVKSK
jgi:cytochrome c